MVETGPKDITAVAGYNQTRVPFDGSPVGAKKKMYPGTWGQESTIGSFRWTE